VNEGISEHLFSLGGAESVWLWRLGCSGYFFYHLYPFWFVL